MADQSGTSYTLSASDLILRAAAADGSVEFSEAKWPAWSMPSLLPRLRIHDQEWAPEKIQIVQASGELLAIEYVFACKSRLAVTFKTDGIGLSLGASFINGDSAEIVLQEVCLLATDHIRLDEPHEAVRVLTQGNYSGRVVSLMPPLPAPAPAEATAGATPVAPAAGEPNVAVPEAQHASDLVSVVYSRTAHRAFLAGFETSERWFGQIRIVRAPDGNISYRFYFDGGDLLVNPGEELPLESAVFMTGADPWALLETYAERVRQRHNVEFPQTPPVSWCSWYPYRLGVTQERLLETARIATPRLKPLGLKIIEVDLGWQCEQLPNAFEENEQFSKGLKWLSDELGKMGFDLGVWTAPFTISEFDPVAKEHPDWLIQDEQGKPAAYWTWYWKPFGNVYVLDLTHPGAQAWLKERFASLHDRGVRYLKSDFIGCVSQGMAKRRHDRRIVAGGGTEAARIGARIIRDATPDALQLNCGGPEMPGTGFWPLFYTCSDTGNTGFITADFQRDNYQTVACHLFKNKRWGVMQPSCLCVGLPGTLEEARLRATIAFLAGGQIDISDTLTTLPEDRWAVLTATLPPLGLTAKPIDLFDAVYGQKDYGYASVCQEQTGAAGGRREHSPGSVWHLHVKSQWDEWDLVAVYSFDTRGPSENPNLSYYAIPLSMLSLSPEPQWGYEFWSRQFLGNVPGKRTNPRDYTHPGDIQDLVVGNDPGTLEVAFVGPGVKLLCLKKTRPHPWVVGTSFHQSCGTELAAVTWDEATGTLRGEIRRPRGETGCVVIAPSGRKPRASVVEGLDSNLLAGSQGAFVLPITMRADYASWQVSFEAIQPAS